MISTTSQPQQKTFREVLTDAINDFAVNGYDSEYRLKEWLSKIRAAAEREMVPEHEAEYETRQALQAIYRRLVDNGGLIKQNPGAGRFTLERVKPQLRAELDRRILASAALIKLRREEAINQTLQRFSGWATSIPPGGGLVRDRPQLKANIKKSVYALDYIDRRRNTDQGHKFAANLSNIFARDGGAVAMVWRHHWSRYPRKEHVERDGNIFLIRDSWAHQAGLVKPNKNGYYDDIEKVGELVMCRCSAQWIMGLSQLPPEMLTKKGAEELARVREQIAQMRKAA